MHPVNGYQVDIPIDKNVSPIFKRHYNVSYSFSEKVKSSLSKLQSQGIISPLPCAEWATPIVIAPKKDTTDIRICAYFKITLNTVKTCLILYHSG